MHCIHCGKKLSENSRFCKDCGKSTSERSDPKKIKLPASADEKRIVRKWSWGGFGLGWIYMAGMRTGWLILLFLILNLIPLVNIISMIYLGIEGRKIAWERREWKDFDEYGEVQRKWDVWGIAILILQVLLVIYSVWGE